MEDLKDGKMDVLDEVEQKRERWRWKKRSPTYPSLKCKAISKKRYR